MHNNTIVWVRFIWDLLKLDIDLRAPAGYTFRSASSDESTLVTQVVLTAYSSDPVWGAFMTDIEKRMTERMRTTLGSPDSDYIVAEYDRKIVAVSGIAKSHWTEQNLLTGICVLADHQRKGLGKYLLGLSLVRLRDMGLLHAKVYTETGSLADRKIYPLFGSIREEGVDYPGLQPHRQEDRSSR